MINLVEVSQLVDLPQLLEYRVVEECIALFNSNRTYRETQKSKLIQKLSLQYVDLQEPYVALVDMGMIWSMATPTAEDRQTQDDTPYKWSDYVHKVSSIILARHGDTDRIIYVNDPYDAAYSTKDTSETSRCRVRHVSTTPTWNWQTFLCQSVQTAAVEGHQQGPAEKLICSYLTDLAQSVDIETIYSVGPLSTNVSTQQPMQNHNFDLPEADIVLFSAYAVLRESGYTGPVVIDATDTDAYGKGKKSVYDKVAKSPVVRRQLSRCRESLDLEEEVVTRHVIYGDNKSSTLAEARAANWKRMKNKSSVYIQMQKAYANTASAPTTWRI